MAMGDPGEGPPLAGGRLTGGGTVTGVADLVQADGADMILLGP